MRKRISVFMALILFLAMFSPLGVNSATAAGTSQPGLSSCSVGAPKVTPLHTQTFYEDVSMGYVAQWVGYRFEATNVSSVAIGASSLTASRLQTRTLNPVVSIDPNRTYTTSYALFEDVGPKGGNLTHTIAFVAGGKNYSCTFTFKSIINAPKQEASRIESLSTANLSQKSTAPIIYSGQQGQQIALAVDGIAPIVQENSLVSLSPTPSVTWPSNIDLQLVSVRWRVGTDKNFFRDQLWFASGSMSQNSSYHVEYIFQVNVGATSNWSMSPTIFVQDSLSTEHSVPNFPAQFSVIDEPNRDFHAAVNHMFTGIMTVAGGTGGGYVWSLQPGQELPEGLTLSSNGQVTGVPKKIQDTTAVSFDVSSGSSNPTKITVNFTISDAAIVTNISNIGYLNVPFGPYRLQTAGLSSAANWGIDGNIPPGLQFSNGYIFGTPTAVGSFEFKVRVLGNSDEPRGKDKTGKENPARSAQGARNYKITIKDQKTNGYQNFGTSGGGLDLSLGASNGYDENGYISAFDGPDCEIPIYSNELPPTGAKSDASTGLSTPSNSYKVGLSSGFCIQAEILIDSTVSATNRVAKNVKVTFNFFEESGMYQELLASPESVTFPSQIEQVSKPASSCSTNINEVGTAHTIIVCLGDLRLKSLNNYEPVAVKIKLQRPNNSESDPIQVRAQVTSDSPEYDNNSGQNNGCGNGDQSAPGNSQTNNGAENNTNNNTSFNCPSQSPNTVPTNNLVASKPFNSTKNLSVSSKTGSNSTKSIFSSEAEVEKGFCKVDDENELIGTSSTDGFDNSKDDDTDSGSDRAKRCAKFADDLNNVASMWLGNKPTVNYPDINLKKDPDDTDNERHPYNPTNKTVDSKVTLPPSDNMYFAVICYSSTSFTTNGSSLPSTAQCYVASNNRTVLLSNGSSNTVSIPAPVADKCLPKNWYAATYLIKAATKVPDFSAIAPATFGLRQDDEIVDRDPTLDAYPFEIGASDPTDSSCSPDINLKKDPGDTGDDRHPYNPTNKTVDSKVTLPPSGNKYFAVICYSSTSFTTNGSSLPSTAQCYVASNNGTVLLSNGLSNTVSIPAPVADKCLPKNWYAATYLIKAATKVPDFSAIAPATFGLRQDDEIVDRDPTSDAYLFEIGASDPTDSSCSPDINLKKDPGDTGDERHPYNPDNKTIDSKITIPQSDTNKYFAVICYSSTSFSTTGSSLPSTSTIKCYVASKNGVVQLVNGSINNVSTSSPTQETCNKNWYTATYLISTSGDVPDAGSISDLRSVDPNKDKIVARDPVVSAHPFVVGGSNPSSTACSTPISGGGGGGSFISAPPQTTPPVQPVTPPQPPLPAPTPPTPIAVLPAYTPIAQCSGSAFCTKIDVKKAETLYRTVTSNQGRFVASGGLILLPPGIPEGYTLAFPNTVIPKFKGKALFSLNEAGNGIIVTSDSGWTGFLHIDGIAVPPVAKGLLGSSFAAKSATTNSAGIAFSLDVQIYPDPSPKASYTNTSDGKTTISWDKSPTETTVGYEVYFNGGKVCSTKVTTCSVKQLVGPRSTMAIVAIGGAKTRSVETKPLFQSKVYALALTVHYDTAKATLKSIDIKALNVLINFIKREGYKQVSVVGHTDPRLQKVNLALSKARAQSVIAYLAPRLKGVTYTAKAVSDKVPFAKGNSKTALALNRRSEIFVK